MKSNRRAGVSANGTLLYFCAYYDNVKDITERLSLKGVSKKFIKIPKYAYHPIADAKFTESLNAND